MECVRNHWPVIACLLLAVIHIAANLEARAATPETDPKVNEFAADLMSKASAAGITAVSLLLSATFVIVQISNQPTRQFSVPIKISVFGAAISLLVSMMFGLFLMWVIPTFKTSKNVNQQFVTILPFGFQLITLLTGVLYLVSGFYRLMFGG